ncbi:hypothetical protein D3C80_357350 [compost metagenome]
MVDFYGDDPASRAWRREQMDISNDIAGLPRDVRLEAMAAALDAVSLSDEERIIAMTAYFKSLASSRAEAVEGVCSSKKLQSRSREAGD